MSELNAFTVLELKDRLRARGLTTTGSKPELVARLLEADPTNTWMEQNDPIDENASTEQDGMQGNVWQREVELHKREKALMERELELARREIEMLRERQSESVERRTETVMSGAAAEERATSQAWLRPDLKIIADLLSDFDGTSSDFDMWEEKIRFLRATYRLSDDQAKLLVGVRLKKRAFDWFHSKSEFIRMPFEVLLGQMRAMFRHRESKLALRRKFESQTWKKEEAFREYSHEKIILGNRVPVDEDEFWELIIDGIPDITLRDQARIQRFSSVDALLEAFEGVALRERGTANPNKRGGSRTDVGDGRVAAVSSKRCFNCGERDHVNANCQSDKEFRR